jgi:hypothetical protein
MSKDIKYKVTYNTTKLPVNESVNLLEAFTRKQSINDAVVNEQLLKFVLNEKPKLMPTFFWYKLIRLVVRKEIHYRPTKDLNREEEL